MFVHDIPLGRGDQVSYFFTHSVGGVDCNTSPRSFINQGSNYNNNNNNDGVGQQAIINTACGRTKYISEVTATPSKSYQPLLKPSSHSFSLVVYPLHAPNDMMIMMNKVNPKKIKAGSGNMYDLKFKVTDGSPLIFVDAHYTITRNPAGAIQPWQFNDRMDSMIGDTHTHIVDEIELKRGNTIHSSLHLLCQSIIDYVQVTYLVMVSHSKLRMILVTLVLKPILLFNIVCLCCVELLYIFLLSCHFLLPLGFAINADSEKPVYEIETRKKALTLEQSIILQRRQMFIKTSQLHQ
jgi:hypothetical protein